MMDSIISTDAADLVTRLARADARLKYVALDSIRGAPHASVQWVKELARFPHLENLSVIGGHLEDRDAQHFAAFTLKKLALVNTRMSEGACVVVVNALRSELTHLSLASCGMGPVAAAAFAARVPHLYRLENLVLDLTEVAAPVATDVVRALLRNTPEHVWLQLQRPSPPRFLLRKLAWRTDMTAALDLRSPTAAERSDGMAFVATLCGGTRVERTSLRTFLHRDGDRACMARVWQFLIRC